MDKFQEERQRREEWYAVAAESRKTILRCYKCPMWSFCPHGNVVLSKELRGKEEEYSRTPYLYAPSPSKIEGFKEKIVEMELVKEKCPLVKVVSK